MLLFPRLTQLDLTGPYEVLSRLSDTNVLLLWKTREAVISNSGMSIMPTVTLDECAQLDIVFVPGGSTLSGRTAQAGVAASRESVENARELVIALRYCAVRG